MYYNKREDKEVVGMKKITTNNRYSIYKFNKGEGSRTDCQYGVVDCFFEEKLGEDISPIDMDFDCKTLAEARRIMDNWS